MNPVAKRVRNTYVALMFGNTLAASLIWGINTIFLLDAGLSNFEAFAANAFFTLGMVVFEVPTGVVADTRGRQTSYMLGALTLTVSTIAYLFLWGISGPFWAWAVVSMLLGLGFTFFSGALEAWVVDALHDSEYKGSLESIFSKGQISGGVAMLCGSVLGGIIAQATNLGVPYMLRALLLMVVFGIAWKYMKDMGFKPERSPSVAKDIKKLLNSSIEHGLRNPPVRWLMIAGLFSGGVGIYVFYAMQPYLLELYGNSGAYGVAGLAAAIVAGAQIVGGMAAPKLRTLFKKRTTALIFGIAISVVALVLSSQIANFWVVIGLLVVWGLAFSVSMPIRQAYLNDCIPSKQRATVLSFDSLMSSSGGAISQPILGKTADSHGYATSFFVSAVIEAGALPFLYKARLEHAKADTVHHEGSEI